MLKDLIGKENLHKFLANSQKVTTRAIRLAEKQNQEKYDREAMGALMKAAGYSLDDLINYLVKYPKVFDFEENIEKLKVLDSLSNVLGNRYSYLDVTYFQEYKALSGFISKYFKNYTNEHNGRLNFYVKTQVEYGMKAATVLVCESIDLISSLDKPSKTHYISLLIPDIGISFTLDSIIDNVKKAFADYKEVENSKTVHNIKQTIHVIKDREYDKNTYIGMAKAEIDFKNEVFLDYIELSYEDKIIIRPTFYEGSMLESAGYYFINGLEYKKDCNLSSSKELITLYDYLLTVSTSMNILDNVVISANISKVNEIRQIIEHLEEDEDEDELDGYMLELTSYITNIEHTIYENISKGLAKSLKDAEKNIDIFRPAWNTIKKSSLKKEWEMIEENVYTKQIEI